MTLPPDLDEAALQERPPPAPDRLPTLTEVVQLGPELALPDELPVLASADADAAQVGPAAVDPFEPAATVAATADRPDSLAGTLDEQGAVAADGIAAVEGGGSEPAGEAGHHPADGIADAQGPAEAAAEAVAIVEADAEAAVDADTVAVAAAAHEVEPPARPALAREDGAVESEGRGPSEAPIAVPALPADEGPQTVDPVPQPPVAEPGTDPLPPPPARHLGADLPVLTDEAVWPTPPMVAGVRADADVAPAAAPEVDAQALVARVLDELAPHVDGLFEARIREALAPALARAADGLIRETRHELAQALHAMVEEAVARALHQTRQR